MLRSVFGVGRRTVQGAASVVKRGYYSLETSGLPVEKQPEVQKAIFPGYDHLALPNIKTLAPKAGQDAREVHDAAWYTAELKEHGHVMIKNTGIRDAASFKAWEGLFYEKSMYYQGGESNRDDIGEGVLNVNTFEPPHIDIPLHNELSYQDRFPERLVFCCLVPAKRGGMTLLGDNRKISKFMGDKLKRKFIEKGLLARHVYQNRDALRAGLETRWYNTWQDAYRVKTREEMERILEEEGYSWEFRGPNDRLYAEKHHAVPHYHEGELYLFDSLASNNWNYFQFIDGFNTLPREERPFDTVWGDGEPLSDAEWREFITLQARYTLFVPYEAGDVFLIDNVKFKHGRTPFEGPRKVGALMGNPVDRKVTPDA